MSDWTALNTDLGCLLAALDDPEFTPAMFHAERAELVTAFHTKHGIAADAIDDAIRAHALPCTNPLVERWIELYELEPYLDLEEESK